MSDFPEFSRVFIGNLDHQNVTKNDLTKVFEKYGEIQEEIKIHRGFSFAQYKDPKRFYF
jgi:nuclear polyadenylated RNA-binding protein 3